MVALITPMHADGSLDMPSMQRLIDFHIDQGSDAIVAVGTTGESATLNEADHCALLRDVVAYVDGRIPVIAGTGANSTTEAIDLTRCAQRAGADACLLVTPYYNKPTQEGLYRHHLAIAQAVDIPQILYNVPGRTACDMLPETIARLSSVDNIIGVKEATGDLSRVRRIKKLCGDDFLLFSGDDATSMEFMLLGGDGVISVTANLAPKQMHAMCAAALAGDQALARSLDEPLTGLHRHLFIEANPIPVKWGVAELGLCAEGIRLPLTWLSESARQTVKQAMRDAGIA